jgi:hypothetical protein
MVRVKGKRREERTIQDTTRQGKTRHDDKAIRQAKLPSSGRVVGRRNRKGKMIIVLCFRRVKTHFDLVGIPVR